ncbi:MAG: hypothetical protein AABX59_00725, partial [Nanoarchaeota archaeon]
FRGVEIEIRIQEREIERIKLLIKRGQEERNKISSSLENFESELNQKLSESKEKDKISRDLGKKFKDIFVKRNLLENTLKKREGELGKKENLLREEERKLKDIEIERAKIEEFMRSLEEEGKSFEKLKERALQDSRNEVALRSAIESKQKKLESLGSVNLRALEVYDEAKKEYDMIYEKFTKLESEKAEIMKIIEEIDKKKGKSFMKNFDAVKENFQRIFSRITGKGQAILELENEKNPFEEGSGIDIRIKIGKGKYLDIRSLSGGEKSLTALSFIFAIQEFKPHHFYLLDEVDAALDKRNSERLSSLLKEYVKKAQYICVTHNDAMISSADVLYGVSMQDGSSKIVSLKL